MTSAEVLREQLSTTALGYITVEVPPRPAADLSSPEALARAADEVPLIEPERRPSGRSVAAIYAEILGASVAPREEPDPPAVIAARTLLFVDDSERVPTRLYRTYLHHKQAYEAARAAGLSGQAEWTALQTTQPGRIETALATLAQHRQTDLSAAFTAAREAFAAGQRDGEAGPYYVCNATPPNFWVPGPGQHGMADASSRPPMRVMLERRWLRFALLTRDGWSVPGRPAGAYSNGRADTDNTGLLALIPIALFVGWAEDETPMIVAWENLVVPPCPPRGDLP